MSVIRNLLIKVGIDTGNFQRTMLSAGTQLKGFGRSLESTGKTLTSALTMPALAASAAVFALTAKTAALADNITTLSKTYGLTTDEIQEMQYAENLLDVSLETMGDSMVKLTKSMDAARNGTKLQVDAFKQLGVEYQNADGSLRDSKDVWYDVIDALGGMSNEADRDALSLRLFGRSAADLNPLIVAGSAALKEYAQAAHDTGAVIDSDALGTLNTFQDTLDEMKSVLTAATAEVGAAFAPALMALKPVMTNTVVPALKSLAGAISGVFNWYNNLTPSAQKFMNTMLITAVAVGPVATGIGSLTIGISKMFSAIGNVSKAISSGSGLLSVLKAATSSAGLVIVAVMAVTAAVAALAIAFGNTKSKTSELKKELDELRKSSERSREEFEDQITEINSNAYAAAKLTDKLYALADKENKTNAEKQQMKTLIEQLNKIYPELNLQIDEQTGALNKQYETVQDLIAAKKQEILYNAYQETWTTLIEEENALLEKKTAAQENYNVALEKYNNHLAAMKVNPAIDQAGIALETYYGQLQDAQDVLNSATSDYNTNIAAQNQVTAQMEATANAAWFASDAIEAAGDATDDYVSDATKAYDEWLGKFESMRDDYMRILTDTSTDEIKQNKLSAQSWENMLNDKAEALTEWNTSMSALAGRVPDAMLEYLRDMGPEYSKLVSQLADMSDADLADAIAAWQNAAGAASSAAYTGTGGMPYAGGFTDVQTALGEVQKTFDTTAEEATKAGSHVSENFADGLYKSSGRVVSVATSMAQRAVNAMKNAMSVNFKLTATGVTSSTVAGAFNARGGIRLHAEGVILTRPTVLDIGGEAGSEALLPLDQHTEWMDTIADKVVQRMGPLSVAISSTNNTVLDGRIAATSNTKQQKIIDLVKGVVTAS